MSREKEKGRTRRLDGKGGKRLVPERMARIAGQTD